MCYASVLEPRYALFLLLRTAIRSPAAVSSCYFPISRYVLLLPAGSTRCPAGGLTEAIPQRYKRKMLFGIYFANTLHQLKRLML